MLQSKYSTMQVVEKDKRSSFKALLRESFSVLSQPMADVFINPPIDNICNIYYI